MKYFSKLKLYKASNVSFNPATCRAYSYDWWRFVDKINGLVIFNDYNYSPSTNKHQWKIRSVLRDLGIKIDLEIEAPKGLQSPESAIAYHTMEVTRLKNEIAKPRSHKAKNVQRQAKITELNQKIDVVNKLLGRQLYNLNNLSASSLKQVIGVN